MNYRYAPLLRFSASHEFFAGTATAFLDWEPTPDCRRSLEQQRLLFRREPNGGVVLYEVNTGLPGASPLIPWTDDLPLRFSATAGATAFAGATEPPPVPGQPFYFTNRRGTLVDGLARPHPGLFAAAADTARLVRPRTAFRYDGVGESEVFRVRDAAGSLVWETTPVPVDGRVEVAVDLQPWSPGWFEVELGTRTPERIFADANLVSSAPAAILELVLRPVTPGGFAIVEADGAPVAGGRAINLSWRARTTVWRYAVIPRSDPAMAPTDLRIQHLAPSGTPFLFEPAGTQVLPANPGVGALFDSTTPIGLRALPYRGLTVERRPGAGEAFVPALSDLPNPRPESLSLASTPARPVSEVFVYL